MAWDPTESERSEHGVRPDTRFPEEGVSSYQRKTSPLDKEGHRFMSINGEHGGINMQQIVGLGRGNAKRIAWETDAPQWRERTGVSGKEKVWYSLGEVKNWVGNKRSQGSTPEEKAKNEADYGPMHDELTRLHTHLTNARNQKIKNGERGVGDLENQVDVEHKFVHTRMKHAPKGIPTVTDSADSPQGFQVDAPRSGSRMSRDKLNRAILHGFVTPYKSEEK